MVMMVMATMPSLLAFRELLSIVTCVDHVDGMAILVFVLDQKAEQTLGMETKTSTDDDADEALVAIRERDKRLHLVIDIQQMEKESIVRREEHEKYVTESCG